MVWSIFVILLALWMLGLVGSSTLGGVVQLLFLLGVGLVLMHVIERRSPV
jgi:hypothetical protein